jgi:toxin-antitoxin system PIN domain toxin
VILVDSNILIYAYASNSPHHQIARDWLDQQIDSEMRVGIPWPSLLAFLRLVTNPRIANRPISIADAWLQVGEWLACPSVWTPQPTEKHSQIFGELLTTTRVQGNLVMDAHLAALAIEHGLTLCSADSDFAKFSGLRWMNPLLPQNSE